MPFEKGNKHGKGGRRQLSDEDRMLLCKATPQAIRRQIELMGDDNGKVALLACQAVLDRYYGKPLQMVDMDANVTLDDAYEELTDEQLEAAHEILSKGKDGDKESA